MNGSFWIATAAAAVVVLALIGVNLLPGTAGVGGPLSTPVPTATAGPTPSPTGAPPSAAAQPTAPPDFGLPMSDVRSGRLDPGTYAYLDVDGDGINVRFTVPAGWTWNGRYLSKDGVGPPDGAAIFFFGGPLNVYADPCHWADARSNPPTQLPLDLVTALAAQSSRNVSIPIDRPANSLGVANRWEGMAVELTVPAGIDFAACDGGQFRSWGPDSKARSNQGPGQRDLVWAVDVGGVGGAFDHGGLIIDAASFPGTPTDIMSEMSAILGSIAVGHWG